MGEKELVISTLVLDEYIEEDEEALETSFQSLEVASATNVCLENPTPSAAEVMAFRVMIKGGYQPGKRLGPHLNGIPTPITIQENAGKAGLDYQGGNEDPSQPDKPVEDESTKAEALGEMERWIEQERPKFQPLAEDLEGINLKNKIEKREVQVG
ncbi:hypothetical protein CR513_25468, partial [Mucuna pruriens]